MALYAIDEDDLIFAAHAEKGKSYSCLECFQPVKVRRGKDRFPHFYHLRLSPQCRLYSKSEDHLRAQIELQHLFPEGELQIERPFPEIGRVSDLCWTNKKIVFEIQCSPLDQQEAESRIADYRSAGFETVWLLDDRRYNRKVLRPTEEFLRKRLCYYIRIGRSADSFYYDQFEIFSLGRRSFRGRKLKLNLQCPAFLPNLVWDEKNFPEQILRQITFRRIYFQGDRIDKALRSFRSPSYAAAMRNWRILENQSVQAKKKIGPFARWIEKWIGTPYCTLLNRWIQRLK